MDDTHATLDHPGWFQCAGFGRYSFSEAQHIPKNLQPVRAAAVGRVTRDIVESLAQAHTHTRRYSCALDRCIKIWLLLLFFFCKNHTIKRRSVPNSLMKSCQGG
eukprot:14580986-Ditylum_brightwellii.AAC.1